jgi:enoyl-[acyl-carrier protein] reductase II
VRAGIDIPLIGAGGIASGRGMLAAEILGAEGAQVGTRFAVSQESSAHLSFKQKIIGLSEGQTILTLKQLTPVRLVKNKFYDQVREAEHKGASVEQLNALLGKRRSKMGIFDGDLDDGELEIGQVSAAVRKIQSAEEIVEEIWEEYKELKKSMGA